MTKTRIYFRVLLLITLFSVQAQLSSQEKKWFFNGSFGFGYSSITNMPADIYHQGRENLQFGVMLERVMSKKLSLVSMLEYDVLNYSFDGYISPVSRNTVMLEQAAPGIKYGGIRQKTLGLNLLGRVYLKHKTFQDDECVEGSCTKAGALFIQAGARVVGSMDFLNAPPFQTVYHYRENNAETIIPLHNFINHALFQVEFSIGVKGRFNNFWSILNSSTVGLIYQFTPILTRGSQTTELNPMHLSWRFLF